MRSDKSHHQAFTASLPYDELVQPYPFSEEVWFFADLARLNSP